MPTDPVTLSAKEFRSQCAKASNDVLAHPLVVGVVDEQQDNLCANGDALVRYGLNKIAMYAAQVSRAMTLGVDPENLRITDEESNERMLRIANICAEAGKPAIIVIPDADAAGEPVKEREQ